MKHLSTIIVLFLSFCSIALCAQGKTDKATETQETNSMETGKKVLVAFFSHTGENYAVGNITKGNTHIIAEMIAEAIGGRLFEIVPVKEYPKSYSACVEVAKKEKVAGARPAVKDDIAVEDYEVVFIGYPNWWGICPCRSIRSSRSTAGQVKPSSRFVHTKAADFPIRKNTLPMPAKVRKWKKDLP